MSEPKDPFARPGAISGVRPFGKESLNPKAPEEIFSKSGGGGGSAAQRAREARERADPENPDQPENIQDRVIEFPVEAPPAQGRPESRSVKLIHARWDREKGFFNKKAKASVEAVKSDGGRAEGRVEFILYAVLPEGNRERIDGLLADLRSGYSEAEFTLFYGRNQLMGQPADYFFTARHPESGVVVGPVLEVEAPKCDDAPQPAPADELGKCPYYVWRNRNFTERHQACPRKPPEYYLGYGYKYCVRFSMETYPKLSEQGKRWLAEARFRL